MRAMQYLTFVLLLLFGVWAGLKGSHSPGGESAERSGRRFLPRWEKVSSDDSLSVRLPAVRAGGGSQRATSISASFRPPAAGLFRGRRIVLAGDPQWRGTVAKREALIRSLLTQSRGTLPVNEGRYHLVPSVRAVPEEALGATPDVILDRKAGFLIYELKPGEAEPSGARPVIYDERSGRFAVVTGGMAVRWNDPATVGSLERDYQMRAVQSFDRLRLTFFQTSHADLSELMSLYRRLQSDGRVVEVSLHLIDRTVNAQ